MRVLIITLATFLCSCAADVGASEAPRAERAPVIDGIPGDVAWQRAGWVDLRYSILETNPSPADFSGRYKVVWTPEYLFVLAEITDDILIDSTL